MGLIAINKINWREKVADVGYWLSENASGKGTACLALQGLIQCCWKNMKMNSLTAQAAMTNLKSQRVLEKSGFINIKILPQSIQTKNQKVDAYLYRIDKYQ